MNRNSPPGTVHPLSFSFPHRHRQDTDRNTPQANAHPQKTPSTCDSRVRGSKERGQTRSPIHLPPIALHPRPIDGHPSIAIHRWPSIGGQTVLQPHAQDIDTQDADTFNKVTDTKTE